MKCYTQFIYVISCPLAYGSYDILLVHIYHINVHVLIQSRTWTHKREIIFTKCNHHTIHVGCSLVRKFKAHNKVWIKFSVKSCSCANCWKGLQHPPFSAGDDDGVCVAGNDIFHSVVMNHSQTDLFPGWETPLVQLSPSSLSSSPHLVVHSWSYCLVLF